MTTTDVQPQTISTNRGATIALWVLQSLLALAFFGAGAAKLAGASVMVDQFEAIGFGQWLRTLTGALEIVAAVLLVVPGRAGYGALIVACVMVGAAAVHVFVLRDNPAPPLVFLALAAVVVWARLLRAPRAVGLRVAATSP